MYNLFTYHIKTKQLILTTGLPEIDDCRVALLGPRVRRTLYRQDKIATPAGSLGSGRSISR